MSDGHTGATSPSATAALARRDDGPQPPATAGRPPLTAASNPALSARAGLHWRGRLVELILPALFPPMFPPVEDRTAAPPRH
jgi:hypothetical protein